MPRYEDFDKKVWLVDLGHVLFIAVWQRKTDKVYGLRFDRKNNEFSRGVWPKMDFQVWKPDESSTL